MVGCRGSVNLVVIHLPCHHYLHEAVRAQIVSYSHARTNDRRIYRPQYLSGDLFCYAVEK